jgi:hypothetical protein
MDNVVNGLKRCSLFKNICNCYSYALVRQNIVFLHGSLDFQHLQDAMHGTFEFLQLQSFVLQPVEHVHLKGSSHAFGTDGSAFSSGIKVSPSLFQPIVSGCGKTGCCK